jgi:polyhydroxyalkanoate synthesis regulator phasin
VEQESEFMKRRLGIGLVLLLVITVFSPFTLLAQDSTTENPDQQMRELIELLRKKGVISRNEAKNFLEQIDQADETSQTEAEALRKEINRFNDSILTQQRLLKRRIDDMETDTLDPLIDKAIKSEWAQRIKFRGDIRLRYQGDYFLEDNDIILDPEDPDTLMNTTVDRNRFRYRARLWMKAKLLDYRETNVGKVETGFRLVVGNETVPVSTNDTLGDYFNKDGLVFDRAYLKWKWSPIETVWNRIPQVSLVGGRFANPWYSTDLVWDNDLNFEGAAVTYETDTESVRPFNMFATAGFFPLQEVEFSSRDKWMWGAQLGFRYRPRYDMVFTLGTAFYDYQNIEGIQNNPAQPGFYDFTAPLYQQKGNTLMDIDPTASIKTALATDYNIVDIYLNTNLGFFFPVQIILEGQYVNNIGFDSERVTEVTGIENPEEDTEAYMVGITLGYPKIVNFGEWNVGLKYKYLGADSVLDAFTDSDFHLGGTNAKGWILRGEFGIYRNIWLMARWLSSDEISGPQFGVDTLQIDINARF